MAFRTPAPFSAGVAANACGDEWHDPLLGIGSEEVGLGVGEMPRGHGGHGRHRQLDRIGHLGVDFSAICRSPSDGYSPSPRSRSAHHCRWLFHSVSRLPNTAIIGVVAASAYYLVVELAAHFGETRSVVDLFGHLVISLSSGTNSGTVGSFAPRARHTSARVPAVRCRDRRASLLRSAATVPSMYAALALAGACTTAPPWLPRRTETSPSVSRIRSASRSDTRLTLNFSTSTSWGGSRSPSASSPSMICCGVRWPPSRRSCAPTAGADRASGSSAHHRHVSSLF